MFQLYLGLMSGTSLDGVDAALVDFSEPASPRLIASHIEPLTPQTRDRLVSAFRRCQAISLDEIGELDHEIATLFASATRTLLEQAKVPREQVTAIGSHGITLRHSPDLERPFTWQLGDPNRIAELTGITTVADFRRRDMAAGGQGAPLVPALHQALFHSDKESRAILNLGGIANLTLLPRDIDAPVLGFDTGPANGLMDAWIYEHRQLTFDRDGSWANSGKIQPRLLKEFLSDPYFNRDIPKSTGREHFNLQWIKQHVSNETPEDVQATLAELSAQTVVAALQRWAPETGRVLVCGGGAFNTYLLKRIQTLLEQIPLESTEQFGIPAEWVEAVAFAWLAKQTLNKNAGNIPSVTGASGPRILGGIYYA